MADEHEDEKRATMDMGEHLRTWRLFVALCRWLIAGLAVFLLLLLLFRAHG